jgi:uncharacterized glyoxalase superfamily protein PhnB
MANPTTTRGSAIIPSLRYRDALTAIDWLVQAFGFTKHAVYLGPDNITVQHAQLSLGTGMIMLGSASKPGDEKNAYNKLLVQPSEIGLRSTQGIYLVVADADAVYATAKAAKAEIVMDIVDMSYGGRGFSCHDPEGHLWSIGTYDPWVES